MTIRALLPLTCSIALAALATSASAQIILQPHEAPGRGSLSGSEPDIAGDSVDSKLYEHFSGSNFQSNLNVYEINAYFENGDFDAENSTHFKSVIRFDLSSIPYDAEEVTEAYLTLYITSMDPGGSGSALPGDVTLKPIIPLTLGDTWTEANITWDSFFSPIDPLFETGPVVATTNVTGVGYYTWDITSTVQAWLNGTLANNGLMIETATDGTNIGIQSSSTVFLQDGITENPNTVRDPSLTVVPEPTISVLIAGGSLLLGLRRRRRMKKTA